AQAGADGPFGNAQRGRYLAIVVAVIVAEDDRGRQLGRDPAQGSQQVGSGGLVRRVGGRGGAAQAAQHLADRAQFDAAPVGERAVDRDAVDPRFGGRVGAPARPGLEGLDEGVLGAVLGGFGVGQDRREGTEDAWVSGLVEAVEVVLRAGLVCVGRHGSNNGAGYNPGSLETGDGEGASVRAGDPERRGTEDCEGWHRTARRPGESWRETDGEGVSGDV